MRYGLTVDMRRVSNTLPHEPACWHTAGRCAQPSTNQRMSLNQGPDSEASQCVMFPWKKLGVISDNRNKSNASTVSASHASSHIMSHHVMSYHVVWQHTSHGAQPHVFSRRGRMVEDAMPRRCVGTTTEPAEHTSTYTVEACPQIP